MADVKKKLEQHSTFHVRYILDGKKYSKNVKTLSELCMVPPNLAQRDVYIVLLHGNKILVSQAIAQIQLPAKNLFSAKSFASLMTNLLLSMISRVICSLILDR